jgi:predicted ester cyclase
MTHTATEQRNLDTVQRFYAAEAGRDWDAYFACLAPEFRLHAGALEIASREAFRNVVDQTLATFSNLGHTILGFAADGDVVAFRWRFEGVVRATGRTVAWEGSHWMRLEDGLIVEDWNDADSAEVERQMGAAFEGWVGDSITQTRP